MCRADAVALAAEYSGITSEYESRCHLVFLPRFRFTRAGGFGQRKTSLLGFAQVT